MALIKRVGGEEEKVPLTGEMLEEEKDTLEKRKRALDELLRQECVAKYKIEIMFSYLRSTTQPSAGALYIWESGSKLHGGGDAKVYFCPGAHLKRSGCSAVIPFDNSNYGHNLCPKCGTVWKSDQVIGEIVGRWHMQEWARKVTDYFVALGHNADIYIKQPKQDIRKAAALEQERQMHGDRLEVSRRAMVRYIYPLRRVLQDTQAGNDLYARFYAFLKS
jgi:hypothetical protein